MNGLLKKIITILLVITMLAAVPAASACKGKSNTGSVTEPEKPEPGKPDPDEPEKPDPENPDPDNPEPNEEPKFSDCSRDSAMSLTRSAPRTDGAPESFHISSPRTQAAR